MSNLRPSERSRGFHGFNYSQRDVGESGKVRLDQAVRPSFFARQLTLPSKRTNVEQTISQGDDLKTKKPAPGSKQSRVIAMLQSPTGATIAAMMKATGWQQHSVRGFLAGVVGKRLKLKLGSKKVEGNRIYQITSGDSGRSGPRQSKRRSP
jgi:hypothetical protein